jgi:hypothetical protein
MVDNKNRSNQGGKDPRRFGNKSAADVAAETKEKKLVSHMNRAMGSGNAKRFEVPDQLWSDIDKIYEAAAYSIAESAQSVKEALGKINVGGYADHPQELVIAINGFNRDIQEYANKLLAIKVKHQGKTGKINDDDYRLSLEVADEYMCFSADYQASVLPAIIVIMEQITSAYNNMMKHVPNADQIQATLTAIDDGRIAPQTEDNVTTQQVTE